MSVVQQNAGVHLSITDAAAVDILDAAAHRGRIDDGTLGDMRIYTRSGDAGSTTTAAGQRVTKHDARIETVGALDELSAGIGLIAAGLTQDTDARERKLLRRIQADMFALAAHIASLPTPPRGHSPVALPTPTQLEEAIDRMEDELPPLTSFILPGGVERAARAHQCRTVCRRAESTISRFAAELAPELATHPAMTATQAYVNRLSDYLFSLARTFNAREGVPDSPAMES